MTLKIYTSECGGFMVLTLSGRIKAEHFEELTRIVALQADPRNIIINLQQIPLAGRDAVRFLARCEADGIKLDKCPA